MSLERGGREGVHPFMRSSRTITLFTESRDISQAPTSFLVSILFHAVAAGLVFFGVVYSPKLNTRAAAEHFTVRRLDLDTPEQMRRAARSKVKYPGPRPVTQPLKRGGKPVARQAALRQIAHAQKGAQTLVQPDIASQLTLTQEIPVPTLVIWSPKKTPVKTVVAPLPEKPTAADVRPSPDPPNEELNLADISIAASPVAAPKLPTLPSTTSPVAVQAPQQVQLAPATVSQPSAEPTPAAVMSLSDLKMAQGTVVLPPVNETADSNSPGALAPGPTRDSSGPGKSNQAGAGGAGDSAASGADPPGNADVALERPGAEAALRRGADAGFGQDIQPSSTKITLPKDGQFGAVVVGASLEDEFPEMASVWSGRLAYTVYLHVGLARSWILQYSLPRSDEAAAAGNIARLEAPWPFNIVRPNLASGPGPVEADTIMVHGFVNQAGRFEALNIVFPPQLPQAQFVLSALQQWQFRPATQNGQAARVEVLLIIPEEME